MSDPYSFNPATAPAPGPGSSLSVGGGLAPGSPPPQESNPEVAKLQEQIMRDYQQAGTATQRAENALLNAQGVRQQKPAAVAPFEQAYAKANAQPIPQPPEPKKPPPAPTMEDATKQSGDQMYLTAALFLGSLAGAMTRRPMTNALAAFGGVMQGWAEGKKDLFDQNMKVWEANNKAAVEANKEANESYLRILKSREMDIEQKGIALKIAAAHYDDQAVAQLAEAKDWETIAQMHDQRAKYGEQLMKGGKQAQTEMYQRQAETEVNSPKGEAQAQAIYNYREPAPSPNQRNENVFWYNKALMARVRAIGEENGVPYDQNKLKEAGSRATQLGRTRGLQEANTEASVARAIPALELASRAYNQVPATAFKRINELYQIGASEIGDPAVKNFAVANEELALVWAGLLNPRAQQITVSAQEHARAMISTYDSPEAYNALLNNIRRLAIREREITTGLGHQDLNVPEIPPPQKTTSVPDMLQTAGSRAAAGANSALPAGTEKPVGTPMPGNPGMPQGYNQGTGLSGKSPLDVLRQLYPGATITPQ